MPSIQAASRECSRPRVGHITGLHSHPGLKAEQCSSVAQSCLQTPFCRSTAQKRNAGSQRMQLAQWCGWRKLWGHRELSKLCSELHVWRAHFCLETKANAGCDAGVSQISGRCNTSCKGEWCFTTAVGWRYSWKQFYITWSAVIKLS